LAGTFGMFALFYAQMAAADVRTISFPADKRYGHISAVGGIGSGQRRENLERLEGHDRLLGYAQGKLKVNIPPGALCVFEPSPSLYLNARSVLGADPAGIDGLKITYSGLEEGEEKVCDNFAKYVAHFKALKMIRAKGSSLSDRGLQLLFPLPDLFSIDLSNTYISKSAVPLVLRYPKLGIVSFSNVDMHGADFAKLANLPQLTSVALHNCCLDDADVKAISACVQVGSLDISKNPRITDASLVSIKNMKKLECLDIDSTSVKTDALPVLKVLPLHLLNFDSGKVDMATAKKLFAAFPFLKNQKIVFPKMHGGVTNDEKMLFAPTK